MLLDERLVIIKFLAGTNSCFTGDISAILPLCRTTVNQHLDELKKSGLIQGHITGMKTNYCINPKKIKELKTILENWIGEINIFNDINCC